jgi:hypothetical protein
LVVQTPRRQALDEVADALPFNADVRRQDVISNLKPSKRFVRLIVELEPYFSLRNIHLPTQFKATTV